MENSRAIKGAEYAKEAVFLVSENKNAAARKRMAQLVKTHGNYDAAGLAIFAAWEDAGCPMNWRA